MIVAKYKFNPSIYENYLPEFNGGYANYTTSDTTDSDGNIIRTIESDTLPTLMRFGNIWISNEYENEQKPRRDSLLEVISVDMSSIKSASAMFRGCMNVESVNLNNIGNTITDLTSMFNSCSSLTSLYVSNWDTSNVTTMNYMFRNCSKLTSLDLSSFNTSKVTNMSNMFNSCSSLISLDLNNWNTSSVTDMSYMFQNCSSLTSIDASNWNTSKVTNMSNMFDSCSSLISLDLSNWNTSSVTDMSYMFNGCGGLISLDVSNFNTSDVTNMQNMFCRCSKLTTLDLSKWGTSQVTNMQNMFYNCSSLRKIKMINTTIPQLTEILPTRASSSLGYLFSPTPIPNDKNWNTIISYTGYNITIKSPIPLRKLGDIKDRCYFDNKKGYYCIEQNVGCIVLDGSEDENWYYSSQYNVFILFDSDEPVNCITNTTLQLVGVTWGGVPILGIDCVKHNITSVEYGRALLQSNPTTVLYKLSTPNIIEFPELTNQPRLYQKDFTTINISTDNIKPSKIAIEYNDINNN